jgi:hypothetical protein
MVSKNGSDESIEYEVKLGEVPATPPSFQKEPMLTGPLRTGASTSVGESGRLW